jgi:hypothetical protein
MRDLNQYSAPEWLALKPLIAAFKELRDAAIRDFYCARRPPELQHFLARHAHLRGGQIAVVIAFEHAWLIEILLERFRRFLPDVAVIVADNSHTVKARSEIEDVCRAAGAAYFGLPANPVRNINRSHGNAVNWAYRNIVSRLQPGIFGLFDHDIFPTAPVDLTALLGDQPFYGLRIERGFGWALWAGFSIFRLEAIRDKRPDFNPDMDRGLITGGRNLGRIYRHHDPSKLRFASYQLRSASDGSQADAMHTEVIDGWIHFGGSSYHRHKIAGRDALKSLLPET